MPKWRWPYGTIGDESDWVRILRVETAAIALVARCMLWVERSA